ncbi:MAG: metallophosphoesterase [Candidatus Aenigmatarchaeota archaeon]
MIKFITDQPMLFLEEKSTLVLGDLHIGLDYRLYKDGIHIPDQLPEMEKNIRKYIKKTGSEKIVILGDIKDEVPGINYPEMREIPEFLEKLSKLVDVNICKGNHDTHLEKIVPKNVKIHPSDGFFMDNYFFCHGHTWPSKDFLNCDFLITGHIHPVFEFKDNFGYKITKPVWIKSRIKKEVFHEKYKIKKEGEIEIFVVPSFNQLLGGYPLNRIKEVERISPILKKYILLSKKTELYLLDGTYLGILGEIIP